MGIEREGDGVKVLNDTVISEVGIGISSEERTTVGVGIDKDGKTITDVESGMKIDVSGNMTSLKEGEGELTNMLGTVNVDGVKIATELVAANISVTEGVMEIAVVTVSATETVTGDASTGDIVRRDEKDGVKILMESVNSEDDIGISMLFEDVCTTKLESIVGSGINIIDVDSRRNSELNVGVGSIKNDDEESGNRIAELLSGRTSVVANISEDSGMSISVEMSVTVIKDVSSSTISEVAGLIDIVGDGKINVDVVSGRSMSAVDSGVTKNVGGRDNSELDILTDVVKGDRMDVVISGISKPELLCDIGGKVLVGCVKSELLGGRENVGVGDSRSSMLDRIENEREGRRDDVGRADSVNIGKDVRREFTENITDKRGIEVSGRLRPCIDSELAGDSDWVCVDVDSASDDGSRTSVGSEEGMTLLEGAIR